MSDKCPGYLYFDFHFRQFKLFIKIELNMELKLGLCVKLEAASYYFQNTINDQTQVLQYLVVLLAKKAFF